ncbi:MAG: hypothetical protein IT452_15525 [Planctomycetia bacterium]|nr:hypothetical protein [Planctomycetia bacterium]
MRRIALAVLALASALPAAAQAPADADRAVRARLEDVRLDLDAQDGDFIKAVEKVRAATELNIVIDQQAADALSDETPMGLRLSRIRAANALRWLVRARNLAYTIRDGVVLITTPEGAAGRPNLRLFDVADILSQPRDFPANGESEDTELTAYDLRNIVSEIVEPGSWDSSGRAMSTTGTTLVVQAEPEVLDQIEHLLDALRVLAHFTVSFDARIVDLPAGALPGVPALGSLAPGKAVLTPDEAAALLVRAGDRDRVLQSAHFTCMNGQRTHVRLDRDETSAHGARSQDEAAAGAIETAPATRPTVIEVSPILVVGRDRFFVNLDAVLADPASNPEQVILPKGRIECGRSSSRTLRTSFQVANGGAALFVLGASEDRVRALVLRVSSSSPALSTSTAIEPESAVDQSAARSYEQFLSRRISMDFSETPFSEVLEYLREVGAMNVMVDPQVNRDEGVGEYKVSLKLKDIEIRTALMLLAGMWDLGYGLRDEAVVFTRRDQVLHHRVELYDVRDILWGPTSWTGGPLAAAEDWEHLGLEIPTEESEAVMEEDALLDLIQGTIGVDTWENGAMIESFRGALIVRQTPEVHKALAGFLKSLREATRRQVQIDARVIEVDAAVHDALESGADGPLPEKSRAALERALADGKARVDAAWSLLGMNAQRFHAQQMATREFVQSYEAGKSYPDPVYGRMVGGHFLELRPTIVSGGSASLVVELRAACRDLPEKFAALDLGSGVVQLPASSRASLTTTVAVKSGETRMFSLGGLKGEGGERRRVLVWTLRIAE